jgi:hypothetical protein
MTEYTLTMRLWNPQQGYQALVTAFHHAKAWLTAGHRLVLEIKPETRSSQQNRLLHALFGDVAKQAEWMGSKRTPAEWKLLFVNGHSVATKEAVHLIPGLEGEFLNLREATSKMSKARMASLLEYTMAWAVMHGVELREAQQWTVDPETGEMLSTSPMGMLE